MRLFQAMLVLTATTLCLASEREALWRIELEPMKDKLVVGEPVILKATWTNLSSTTLKLDPFRPELDLTAPDGTTSTHRFFETDEEMRMGLVFKPKRVNPGASYVHIYTIVLVSSKRPPKLAFPTPGLWSLTLKEWPSAPAKVAILPNQGDDALLWGDISTRLLSIVHGEDLSNDERSDLDRLVRKYPRTTLAPYLCISLVRKAMQGKTWREVELSAIEPYLRVVLDRPGTPSVIREEALYHSACQRLSEALRQKEKKDALAVQSFYSSATEALRLLETEFPSSPLGPEARKLIEIYSQDLGQPDAALRKNEQW